MLGAKIAIAETDKAKDIVETIDEAERMVRAAVPTTRVIYLEPDIKR